MGFAKRTYIVYLAKEFETPRNTPIHDGLLFSGTETKAVIRSAICLRHTNRNAKCSTSHPRRIPRRVLYKLDPLALIHHGLIPTGRLVAIEQYIVHVPAAQILFLSLVIIVHRVILVVHGGYAHAEASPGVAGHTTWKFFLQEYMHFGIWMQNTARKTVHTEDIAAQLAAYPDTHSPGDEEAIPVGYQLRAVGHTGAHKDEDTDNAWDGFAHTGKPKDFDHIRGDPNRGLIFEWYRHTEEL